MKAWKPRVEALLAGRCAVRPVGSSAGRCDRGCAPLDPPARASRRNPAAGGLDRYAFVWAFFLVVCFRTLSAHHTYLGAASNSSKKVPSLSIGAIKLEPACCWLAVLCISPADSLWR